MNQCKQCGGGTNDPYRIAYCEDCAPADRLVESVGVKRNTHWANLIRKYGVDKQMWDAMYFEQNGECLICSNREAKVVDHSHETGKPRGLLCVACNGFLGFVESPGAVDSALEYLKEYA